MNDKERETQDLTDKDKEMMVVKPEDSELKGTSEVTSLEVRQKMTTKESEHLDPRFKEYFVNVLGLEETLKRLQRLGKEGVEVLKKHIKDGKFELVVHIMEMQNPATMNRFTEMVLNSTDNDPNKRKQALGQMAELYGNEVSIGARAAKNVGMDNQKLSELLVILGYPEKK